MRERLRARVIGHADIGGALVEQGLLAKQVVGEHDLLLAGRRAGPQPIEVVEGHRDVVAAAQPDISDVRGLIVGQLLVVGGRAGQWEPRLIAIFRFR